MKKKSTTSEFHPEVGMGATLVIGSDRYPATVIQVTQNGKRVVIQEDDAVRTDKNGLSESQTYEFTANPNGTIHIVTLRKDGRYRVTGGQTPVHLGSRDKYLDPSF